MVKPNTSVEGIIISTILLFFSRFFFRNMTAARFITYIYTKVNKFTKHWFRAE